MFLHIWFFLFRFFFRYRKGKEQSCFSEKKQPENWKICTGGGNFEEKAPCGSKNSHERRSLWINNLLWAQKILQEAITLDQCPPVDPKTLIGGNHFGSITSCGPKNSHGRRSLGFNDLLWVKKLTWEEINSVKDPPMNQKNLTGGNHFGSMSPCGSKNSHGRRSIRFNDLLWAQKLS